MNTEVKGLVRDLLKSGFKKEAKALLDQVRTAKGISNEERDLQFRIFNKVLNRLGRRETNLVIDMKKGVARFDVDNMGLIEFPRFLERLLQDLGEIGTRHYKLDRVDRKDPMRVYIKL